MTQPVCPVVYLVMIQTSSAPKQSKITPISRRGWPRRGLEVLSRKAHSKNFRKSPDQPSPMEHSTPARYPSVEENGYSTVYFVCGGTESRAQHQSFHKLMNGNWNNTSLTTQGKRTNWLKMSNNIVVVVGISSTGHHDSYTVWLDVRRPSASMCWRMEPTGRKDVYVWRC